MAIETLKENLCVNQIVGKAKENIVAEGDVIIPDIKPDILSTINTNGTVCIYKKEVLDGKDLSDNINNTQEIFYGSDRGTVNKLSKDAIIKKINNIFASPNHVYKSRVRITLNNGLAEKTIVGKNNTHLITINGELIKINDILDIEKI